jgi:hypothetical protein
LSKKWSTTPIGALEREKQSHPDDQGVQDITDFFVEVFAKAYYLKVQLRHEVADCLNYIRDKYHLDNKEFLSLVKNSPPSASGLNVSPINLQGVLPPETIQKLHNPKLPPPNFVLPLPPQVMQNMAAVAMRPSGGQPVDVPSPAKPEPVSLALPHSGHIKGEGGGGEGSSGVPSVQVLSAAPYYGIRMVKADPDAPPGSVMPASVYNNMASVQLLDSVPPPPGTVQPNQVGRGSKCLQFFYENPQDGEKIAFKPVYVDNDEEVQCVVALVAERAAEYQSKVGLRPRQYTYFSDAVRAKSRLDPDIVRYIERCFTKAGMRDHKKGLTRRCYPKRKQTVIVKSSVKKEPLLDEEEEEEEEETPVSSKKPPVVEPVRVEILEPPSPPDELDHVVDDDDDNDADYVGYVSDEDMSKRNLEMLVFGSVMPKVKLKEKDLAKPPSDRGGRGGHNVRDEANPENVLNAVGFMLNPEDEGVDGKFARQIKEASQFKTRRKTR